jgi:hypothetical protein
LCETALYLFSPLQISAVPLLSPPKVGGRGESWKVLQMNQRNKERIPRTLEDMDMLLSVSTGLLSGLQAQSEITELLDELYYDGLMGAWGDPGRLGG